jgi:hypothetical protein
MRAELYRKHLYYKLYRALQDEGYSDDEMDFEKDTTYVSDIGFFSFRLIHDGKYLFMSHFLVFKDKRSKDHINSVILADDFRKIVHAMGFNSIIFAIPKERSWLEKFSKVAFGKAMEAPYLEINGRKYFYMSDEGVSHENL